ncbi:hypothetical protein ACFOZ1_07935 [Gracilibacillus marinus]|uniref:Uncharacterized protein n=1 Tax=Gracilibacillus marinus TaxID=630535 RepID=A0ABV8VTF9_9BACI
MTTLFMLQNSGDYAQHKVVEVDQSQAQALIESGKAVQTSFGEYDQYRQQAKKLHSDYKKTKAKIEASDNPMYTEDVKKYELDKAYKEYEQATQQLQADWTQKRQEMQAEAYRKAAKATVPVTQSDKEMAEQVANRLTLKVQSAVNEHELAEAVTEAENTINYLSDSEKVALQANIYNVLQAIDSKASNYNTTSINGKGVLSSVQNLSNLDLLAGKLAAQIPDTVNQEYRTLNVVKNGHKMRRSY